MTMDARAPGTTTTTLSSDAVTRRCVVKIAGVWIDTASFRWVFFFCVQDSVFFSFFDSFLLDCGENVGDSMVRAREGATLILMFENLFTLGGFS